MKTISCLLRWSVVWLLLLGVIPLSRAYQGPTNSRLYAANARDLSTDRLAITHVEDIQPILDLIANTLPFMAFSHDDNLKAQALRTIIQALGTLDKQISTPDQKSQIRSLFRQTLQTISGFDNPDWKIELIRTTPGLAVSFSDAALVRESLPTIEPIADSIKDPVYKAGVLSELAAWAVKAGDRPSATTLLTQSLQVGSDTITRVLTHHHLDRLGPWLSALTQPQPTGIDSSWIPPVVQQLQNIEDAGIRANVLTRISRKISLISDPAQQQAIQDQLLRQVRGPMPEKTQARLLTALVEATVYLTAKTIRARRLAQLKQEVQRLQDKAAQREVIRAMAVVGMRTGDQTISRDEFTKAMQQGDEPFVGLSPGVVPGGISFRLQILTRVLGTMARVAAQLNQPQLARQLTNQTLQATIGSQSGSPLLRDLAVLAAQAAVAPADSQTALPLLRQAAELVQGIDELRPHMQAQGQLVPLAAQAGVYTEARILLGHVLQEMTQLPGVADTGGLFGGSTIGAIVASILDIPNRTEAQFLVDQVISRVSELPDGETKAQAYMGIVQSLHARATTQSRLLDENRAYALVSQAFVAVNGFTKPFDKTSALTHLINSADYLCPSLSRALLAQSVMITNELAYPEKGMVQSAIIDGLGSRARRVLLAGDERQAQDLFDQGMQLWTGINDSESRTRAGYTLVRNQALALVSIRNQAVFQRWLSQTRSMVKTVEPYASTLSLVVQTMTNQASQTRDRLVSRPLFAEAIQIARDMNRLSRKPIPMYSLMLAGVRVLDQNQLKVMLTQSLGEIKALRDSTSQARELIALGHACAQRVPTDQVRALTTPILNYIESIRNWHLREYALKELVSINPRVDQKAPAPLLWQQVLAVANTLDDGAAQAATRADLPNFQAISQLLLPKDQLPSLEAQQRALQLANPSVRADVYSRVAESMVYWHELSRARSLVDQARPLYKIQLATGMLTGWLKQQLAAKL